MEPIDVTESLQQAGIPHAFGSITAANEWSFYEPTPSIQIYVPPKAVPSARKHLDDSSRPTGKRGKSRTRIEIYGQAPSNLPIAASNLAELAATIGNRYGQPYREKDQRRRSGAKIPVTTRFISLLDCRVHPEGASHAAFLRDNLTSRSAQ